MLVRRPRVSPIARARAVDDGYADVSATLDVADSDATVALVPVESDHGRGDGNTINDVVVVDASHFRLRQERARGGPGRVYTITYRLTGTCGNTRLLAAEVRVIR